MKKLALLSELQFLATDSLNLEQPLARARARAEIAAAAWSLDRVWSKDLLREAYELTFPSKEEQERLRSRPVGAPPMPPTSDDRARGAVRLRVLEIASQESLFVEELVQSGAQKLGKYEEQLRYAELAHQAAESGALEVAADFIRKATKADPTQITFAFVINKIALTNRAAADSLIIQYIDFLRGFPISSQDQSDMRTMFILHELLFPQSTSPQRILPPGVAVMRAYVSYVLERASRMEQPDLQNSRLWLLSIWGMLKQYAPEMTDAFLALEARSRRPGETVQLPEKSLQDDYKKNYEAQLKEALDSNDPDERAIFAMLSRKEFEKARKLIEKLKDKTGKRNSRKS